MHARTLALALLLLLGSFANTLSTIPSTILEDENAIQFTGNTIDCGTNASNISFVAESSQGEYDFGDTYSGALIAYCGLWDATYKFEWNITADDVAGLLLITTNLTFETNTSSVSYDPGNTDHFNEQTIIRSYLPDGNFTLNGLLYADDGNGGWELLSSLNDSFTVSTNHSTTACGFNTSLVDMRTSTPSTWNESNSSWELVETNNPIIPIGSNGWGLWINVDCHMWYTENRLSWNLLNTNSSITVSQDSHNFSMYNPSTGFWNDCNGYCDPYANGNGSYFYERSFSQFDLLEGNYIFSVELSNYNESSSSWELSEETNSTFEVWNSTVIPPGPHNVDDSSLTLELTNTSYDSNETVIALIEMDYLVIGEEYEMKWWLWDGGDNIVSQWNETWVADENSSSEWANFSELSAGTYCLEAALYVNQGIQYFLRTAEECFTVTGGEGNETSVDDDCAVPTITAISNETHYDVGESIFLTFIVTCPTPYGQNMNIVFNIVAFDTVDVGWVTETWQSNSNETIVFYYEDAGVTLYGPGNYTIYAESQLVDSNGYITTLAYDETYFYVNSLDDDEDGVMNDVDQCPGTAAGTSVNADGCSISQLDADGDGVSDILDACANTPAGETVDIYGCSDSQLDDDGDGVMNDVDQCPGTAAGTSVNADGCSISQLDADGDGVSDILDACANTPAGETVDIYGCSDSQLDDDSDGVMNNADLCPNTAAGETVDANGCAASQYDADGDGVPDLIDQCPGTPSGVTVGTDGCNYPPVCDISYEDGVGNVVSLQSQLEMGTGTSSSSLSLPTGTYQFIVECADPESDALSMTVTIDGGSAMLFTGSPLSTGEITVPVQDGMTLSKTITYYWTDGSNYGTYEIEVSLIGDDDADPNTGWLPGFELWITLLAIITSLFFNRTRKII